ncbi:MAG: hypothetical protein NVS3B26_13240 [Mycobacteriales bacterium]
MIIYTNYRDAALAAAAERLGAGYLLKGELRTLRRAIEAVTVG